MDLVDNYLPCNNNIIYKVLDIYKYVNRICSAYPILRKRLFPSKYFQLKYIKTKYSEDYLKQRISDYYRNIIKNSILYNNLFSDLYIDYFKRKCINVIFTCYIKNLSDDNLLTLVFKEDETLQYYKVLEITKNNILITEHLESKIQYLFAYDSDDHKWKYITNPDLYIVDNNIIESFLSQNIIIDSKVQITNINLSHLNLIKQCDNILSEIVVIKEYDSNTQTLIVEFDYNNNTNSNSLLNVPKSFFKKYCMTYPDKIHLSFQFHRREFKYLSSKLIYNNNYSEEIDIIPLNINNVYIHNIEFINQHIEKYKFNQFVKTKESILSCFHGTELFNIMSSYICPSNI